MSLTFEQVVILIIFLVVLIVLIVFTQIPRNIGDQISLQQELRGCCQAFIARGCPDDSSGIQCGDMSLTTLVSRVGLDIDQTRSFCNCPLNKTFITNIP